MFPRPSRSRSRLAPSRDTAAVARGGDDASMHHHLRRPLLAAAVTLLGLTMARARGRLAADFPPADAKYHTYAEMVADIQATQAAHPDIVALRSIGKSYQGRDLWVAKVSDNVAVDEAEPEVMFDGLHHAREHLSLEQTLAILHWLTDGYGIDQRITDIVEHAARSGSSSRSTRTAPSTTSPARPIAAGARTASRTRARPRSGPTSTATTATTGRAAAGRRARSRRPPTTVRARSRRPSRAPSATSWPAAGSAGASRSRPRSRSTRPARRSCGRTATPRPTSRAT